MSAREGDFELITLRNGHRAVRHVPSGEVMHPSVGPWEEANSLYVEQLGLAARLQVAGPAVRVFDVGLGAGTNAIAALACATELGVLQQRRLEIVSFERDLGPLKLALADPEGFPAQARFHRAAQTLVEQGSWECEQVRWRLELGEVLARLPEAGRAELVFFDPFSPEVNPSLWTVDALKQLRAHCDDTETLLATYSAATPTRLSFLLAGFFVGQGVPVGTKKETTVAATRNGLLAKPLGLPFLERWRRSCARAPHGEALSPGREREIENLFIQGA